MSKVRSPGSLLTKLENMQIGEDFWTKKSNGYVSDNIATVRNRYKERKYRQTSVLTHTKELDDSTKLSDFERIIFVTRIA